MKAQAAKITFIGSIKGQLLLLFLTISLTPLLVVGLLLYNQARTALHDEATNKLAVVRDTRAQQVEEYLTQSVADVNSYAKDKFTVVMMQRFSDAVMSLVRLRDTDTVGAVAEFRSLYLGQPDVEIADPSITYSVVHGRYHNALKAYQKNNDYDDILLVEPSGTIIYSAKKEDNFGTNLRSDAYADTGLSQIFEEAVATTDLDFAALGDISFYEYSQAPGLFVAAPIVQHAETDEAEVIGVLIFQLPLERINSIMHQRAGLGTTEDTYIGGSDALMRSDSRLAEASTILQQQVDTAPVNKALDGKAGVQIASDYRDVTTLAAYKPLDLPGVNWVIVSKIDEAEAFGLAQRIRSVTLLIMGVAAVIVAALALFISSRITNPLAKVTRAAQNVSNVVLPETSDMVLSAKDDLIRTLTVASETLEVKWDNETGQLAQAFTQMTTNLRHLLGQLTGEEQLRRAKETAEAANRSMQASAAVSRAASSILDPDQLIHQVVDLIRKRFNLYYVGLFQVDGIREWALLRAGTGEAGKRMLARGHRIKVGEGMIGWCIAQGQARVASRAEADEVRLATRELPETRSEPALPLRSRGQVVGALTVQSNQPDAFDEALITVLQTMADQVGVALDNARLFAQSQRALEAERRAYGQLGQQAWSQLVSERTDWGYRYARGTIAPLEGDGHPPTSGEIPASQSAQGENGDHTALTIPLRVRDQVVGTLSFHKEDVEEGWTREEKAMLETLVDELGEALESARLHQDTQRRAAREQIVAEVAARIRETLDVDIVLKTAAREMRAALGLAETEIRLGANPTQAISPAPRPHKQEGVKDGAEGNQGV